MYKHEIIERFPDKVIIYDDGSTRISAIGWSYSDLIVMMDSSDGGKVVLAEGPLRPFMNHAPWFFNNLKNDVMEELWQNRPKAFMSSSNSKKDGSASS